MMMPSFNMKNSLPIILVILISVFYVPFKIQVHTWESYYYAGSLDSFIPPEDMKPAACDLPIPYSSLLCLYYTQHPLLHYAIFFLRDYLNGSMSSIQIVQYANLVFAILAYFIFYYLALHISQNRLNAFLLTLCLSWTDVYWYQSMSGEVYMAPFLFILLSFYCLTKWYDTQSIQSIGLIGSALSLGIAVSFHLLSSLFYIVPCYMIWHARKKNPSANYFLHLTIFISTGSVFVFLVYGLPYIFWIPMSSFTVYLKLLCLHTQNWGFWQLPAPYLPFELIHAIILGLKHFVYAIIFGVGWMPCIGRCFVLICSIGAIVIYFRDPFHSAIETALLLWIFVMFLVITVIINVPHVNDYWSFIAFSGVLFCFLQLRKICRPLILKWILIIGCCFLAPINFMQDIYPKSNIKQSDFFIISSQDDLMQSYHSTLFVGNSWLLIEAWYLHNCHPNTAIRFQRSPDQYKDYTQFLNDLSEKLNQLSQGHDPILILVESAGNEHIQMIKKLQAMGYQTKYIFSVDKQYNHKQYKTAMGLIDKPVIIKLYGFEILTN